MDNVLDGLNEQQQQAVLITEGYVRIIAGAGSGKTKALTHRFAFLVKALGIPPGNILCVTFTNKAAGEMKKRVRTLIGDGCDTSLITTYHGFCVRVLREDIGRLFYPENFIILDISDQKKILEEIYNELELKLDHSSFEKILKKIDLLKGNTEYVGQLINTDVQISTENAKNLDDRIVQMYLQRQKKVFGLDFNDLINFTFVLFEKFDIVKEKWQDKLNYIQVDEFQDSSMRELRLINTLSQKNKNLFVVGDPDQNIYEWRGAKVEILVEFDKSHEPTQTVLMNQNYRSTPEILAVANELIDKNKMRIKKDLVTNTNSGFSVIHNHAKDEYAEMMWITQTVKDLIKNGRKYNEIAMLYRASFLSRMIEQTFINENIPYQIFGGVRFFDRMEIKDTLSYLRMIIHGDDLSFSRIINVPRRKFGKAKMNMLKQLSYENGRSLYETLKEYIDNPIFNNTNAKSFIELIEHFRSVYKGMAISQLMQEIVEKSGYDKYIRENGSMERLENLAELRKTATETERAYENELSLEQYLQQIALQNERDNEDTRDCIKLMTIHASKGLEFPFVFIVGMSEGIFPSSRSLEERKQAGLEEERRLCFVAVTRAREQLFLCESEGSTISGSKKYPSRFLFDIGEKNYVRLGVIPKELLNIPNKNEQTVLNQNQKTLEIGAIVNHPVFGEGVVNGIDEIRRNYDIYFDKINGNRPISYDFDWKAFEMMTRKAEVNEIIEVKNTIKEIEKEIIDDRDLWNEIDRMIYDNDDENDNDNVIVVDDKNIEILDEEIVFDNFNDNFFEEQTVEIVEKAEIIEKKDSKRELIDNLWNNPNCPKSGWECTGITDLGAPNGFCQMCQNQIIRYVHHMSHPDWHGSVGAGCVCAGKMEGDSEGAAKRENEFKSRNLRLETFMKKVWKKSSKNNFYIKYKNKIVTIFPDKFNKNTWRAACEKQFSECVANFDLARLAAFEIVEKFAKDSE